MKLFKVFGVTALIVIPNLQAMETNNNNLRQGPVINSVIDIDALPNELWCAIIDTVFKTKDIHQIKQFARRFLALSKEFNAVFHDYIMKKLLATETELVEKICNEIQNTPIQNLNFLDHQIAKTIDAKLYYRKKLGDRKLDEYINRLSILDLAAGYDQKQLIKLLLRSNSDIISPFPYGINALFIAYQTKHADVGLKFINNNLKNALILAAGAGLQETVKFLVLSGMNADSITEHGFTALISSCAGDNAKTTKFLLEQGADVNFIGSNGQTALGQAAIIGNASIVLLLLKHGAKIDVKDKFGFTPLLSAAAYGNTAIVQLLLQYGADINVQNNDLSTALIEASLAGHVDVVKLLLQYGADPNITDIGGTTALIAAAFNDHAEIVKILLDNGALTYISDKDRKTALSYATENNSTEILKMLLTKEPQDAMHDSKNQKLHHMPNQALESQNTTTANKPLSIDAIEQHAAQLPINTDESIHEFCVMEMAWITKLRNIISLLDQTHFGFTQAQIAKNIGARLFCTHMLNIDYDNIDEKINGISLLEAAAEDGNNALITILLAANPNIIKVESYSVGALGLAFRNGHLETVFKLMQNNLEGSLIAAVENQAIEIVKLLINLKVNLNIRESNGYTPLLLTCLSNDVKIAKMLIKAGADVNVTNNEGKTPLILAARNGHTDIAKLLLDNNANKQIVDNQGKTAFDYAVENGYSDIAESLSNSDVNRKRKF